jgi:hypothetical protein
MKLCSECNEKWFEMEMRRNRCRKCRTDAKKHKESPLYSALNDLDPDSMPDLPNLTQIEKMLIARVYIYVEIRQIREQQYRYTDHVVNFHRKTKVMHHKLSLLFKNIDIVILKSFNIDQHHRLQRQFVRDHKVRRRHILT